MCPRRIVVGRMHTRPSCAQERRLCSEASRERQLLPGPAAGPTTRDDPCLAKYSFSCLTTANNSCRHSALALAEATLSCAMAEVVLDSHIEDYFGGLLGRAAVAREVGFLIGSVRPHTCACFAA